MKGSLNDPLIDTLTGKVRVVVVLGKTIWLATEADPIRVSLSAATAPL